MQRRFIVPLAIAVLAAATLLAAHSGGLDAYGGHNDRKAGTYHFHRGPLAGHSYASKAEAVSALQAYQANPTSAAAQAQPRPKAEPQTAEDRTVYITRTGKKYHGANCQYLSRSKIPISLKDARKQGYTACSRCGGR